MEPVDGSINTSEFCTQEKCISEDDKRKITCSKCKRGVHLVCTKLPLYQIKLFFTKNYRGYICINCVNIPEELQQSFNEQEESLIDQCRREIKGCENIIKVQKENQEKLVVGIRKLQKEKKDDQETSSVLIDLIEDKFKQLEEKLNNNIKAEVANTNINKKTANGTFASVVNKKQNETTPDLRKILREEKLNEIEEIIQQDIRKANIMIFGRKESSEVEDHQFVQNLIKDVGSASEVKYMSRIGNKSGEKVRPIKVVFKTPHERFLLLNSLANLKGKTQYEGISVAEDHTLFERSVIRNMSKKAKERNAQEPSGSGIIWRVRGTLSEGLYLRKTEAKSLREKNT